MVGVGRKRPAPRTVAQFISDLPKEQRPAFRTYGMINWAHIRKELHSRPGEWMVAAENVTRSITTRIRQGKYKQFRPAHMYELTTRGQKGGRVTLLMRYVGPHKQYAATDSDEWNELDELYEDDEEGLTTDGEDED